MTAGPLELIIREKLEQALQPTYLEIINDSVKHKGHAGYNKESHFRIIITSVHFKGKKTLANHRLIFDILKDEVPNKIHALSIKILENN